MNEISRQIADYCLRNLDLSAAKLSEEYYYHSLPFAVIDAVFSIGVRYASTRETVKRYCAYYSLQRIRTSKDFPAEAAQHTIAGLLANMEAEENFAAVVLQNRQRTSSTNGILKADAVWMWASILHQHGIETLQSFQTGYSAECEDALRAVPGQHSGISVAYLKMLCGSDCFCKPDRHILRFIYECSHTVCDAQRAGEYLTDACALLNGAFPEMNLRLLDHAIWHYMSQGRQAAASLL